jgi:hypothetical protein
MDHGTFEILSRPRWSLGRNVVVFRAHYEGHNLGTRPGCRKRLCRITPHTFVHLFV